MTGVYQFRYKIEEMDADVLGVYYYIILWLTFIGLTTIVPCMSTYYIYHGIRDTVRYFRNGSYKKEEQGSPLLHSA